MLFEPHSPTPKNNVDYDNDVLNCPAKSVVAWRWGAKDKQQRKQNSLRSVKILSTVLAM